MLFKIGISNSNTLDKINSESEFDLNISIDGLEKIFTMFSKGIEENLEIEKKHEKHLEILDMKLNSDSSNNIELIQNTIKKNSEYETLYKSENFFDKENKDYIIDNNPQVFGLNSSINRKNLSPKEIDYIDKQEHWYDNEKSYQFIKSKLKSDTTLTTFQIENDAKFSANLKLSMEISIFPQNNNFVEYLSFYYICKIWNLWELVITETPLIIHADTPSICQEVVFLISSLIFPLEYIGDTRPYFTIYDNDFKDYRDDSRLKNLNSAIIGVINPICTRMLKGWTVIHLDDLYYQQLKIENPTKNGKKEFMDEEGIINGIHNCKRKFKLEKNKILLKTVYEMFENSDEKSSDKINIYLRMYMIELNNDFMRTFEEYFFTYQLNRIKRLPLIKSNFSIFEIFEEKDFIKYLNASYIYFNAKYVKDKRRTIDLYSLFIQTKIFKNYLKNLM